MIKRLIVGLIVGLFIGAIVAATLIKGLAMTAFSEGASGAVLAYVFAAITGAITGLIAGKPFWAAEAKIEAGLKAFFGALLATGGMFALQHWLTVPLDLEALHAGHGLVGNLPAAAFPLIGGVLGAVFELDNTGQSKKDEGGGGKRIADLRHETTGKSTAKGRARVEEEEEEEAAVPGRRARR